MMWKWLQAITVEVCKECGSDIWPADRVLRACYREPNGLGDRVILCEGCGELYIESQELGQNEEQANSKERAK